MNRNGLLVINAGSSSIKFSIFDRNDLAQLLHGEISGIGADPMFHCKSADTSIDVHQTLAIEQTIADYDDVMKWLIQWLLTHMADITIVAVGHRVVHGGKQYGTPILIDQTIIENLKSLNDLAPLHQPHNIAGIESAIKAFRDIPQIACFDTAFHHQQTFLQNCFAIPRDFYRQGILRYGFHGLSYEYIAATMRKDFPELISGKVIVAHLGNGASMCAMLNGVSVGSTMGFSAVDGLPMGTRCGQIDPGVIIYMLKSLNMTIDQISDLLYKHSGLLALSGNLSHDMRTLEADQSPESSEAIEYFVTKIKRELGSLIFLLGGVDAIVFTAGIGENSTLIRTRVLENLEWMGIVIDEDRNRNHETIFSSKQSRVPCLRIATNEDLMIAMHMLEIVH